jgi:hypothetical protein
MSKLRRDYWPAEEMPAEVAAMSGHLLFSKSVRQDYIPASALAEPEKSPDSSSTSPTTSSGGLSPGASATSVASKMSLKELTTYLRGKGWDLDEAKKLSREEREAHVARYIAEETDDWAEA